MFIYRLERRILKYLDKHPCAYYYEIHARRWVGSDYSFQTAVEMLHAKGYIENVALWYRKDELKKKTIFDLSRDDNDYSGLVRKWYEPQSRDPKKNKITGSSLLMITQDGIDYYYSNKYYRIAHWIPVAITAVLTLINIIVSVV